MPVFGWIALMTGKVRLIWPVSLTRSTNRRENTGLGVPVNRVRAESPVVRSLFRLLDTGSIEVAFFSGEKFDGVE